MHDVRNRSEEGGNKKEMIRVEKGRCIIAGTILEAAADVTMVLASIYEAAKEQMGENEAKELLAGIGRVAVDKDAIDRSIINKHTYIIPR